MIKQKEIQQKSEQLKVTKSQLDKDWVLSYLVYAVYSLPELKNIMIFKGGTCMKKCYIPDYRFSEDLDFTILDDSFVFTRSVVNKIMREANELSLDEEFNRGILFKYKSIVPAISNDIEQGYKISIHYWGADHRKNDMPSPNMKQWHHTIKLDVNHTEEIIFDVNELPINHNYSDRNRFDNLKIRAYSLEEILSEKLRSLIQRKYTSPRDCFDIWFLNKNYPELNWRIIKNAFFKKMQNKNLRFYNVNQLINDEKEKVLKKHWETQLANQFPKDKIPDYNLVINELKQHLFSIFKEF